MIPEIISSKILIFGYIKPFFKLLSKIYSVSIQGGYYSALNSEGVPPSHFPQEGALPRRLRTAPHRGRCPRTPALAVWQREQLCCPLRGQCVPCRFIKGTGSIFSATLRKSPPSARWAALDFTPAPVVLGAGTYRYRIVVVMGVEGATPLASYPFWSEAKKWYNWLCH